MNMVKMYLGNKTQMRYCYIFKVLRYIRKFIASLLNGTSLSLLIDSYDSNSFLNVHTILC